jgi:hyperosmotically inducible periplasmic protein
MGASNKDPPDASQTKHLHREPTPPDAVSRAATLFPPMKKTLLFSTLVIGLALAGCNKSTRTDTAATDSTTTAARTTDQTVASTEAASRNAANDLSRAANSAGDSLERAGRSAANAMSNAAHNVSAKLTEWRLSAQDIQADLAADRDIVRTKEASAGAPTGTMDRSTLKTAVEGRIKADSELANLKLDVNAERGGAIQLEGKALTAEQVGRAIAVALDTEGVTKVTSKIDLDKDAVKTR